MWLSINFLTPMRLNAMVISVSPVTSFNDTMVPCPKFLCRTLSEGLNLLETRPASGLGAGVLASCLVSNGCLTWSVGVGRSVLGMLRSSAGISSKNRDLIQDWRKETERKSFLRALVIPT